MKRKKSQLNQLRRFSSSFPRSLPFSMTRRISRLCGWISTVTPSFTGLPPSSGSNGYVRPRHSFTSSKAKQILPFGTDRDNETRNRFKSRLFTLLVLVLLMAIDPAIAGPTAV